MKTFLVHKTAVMGRFYEIEEERDRIMMYNVYGDWVDVCKITKKNHKGYTFETANLTGQPIEIHLNIANYRVMKAEYKTVAKMVKKRKKDYIEEFMK